MSQSNGIRLFYSTACFVALAFIGRVFVGRSVPMGPHGPVTGRSIPAVVANRPVSTPESAPQRVTLGLYIADLHSVDLREASFAADFYIWMRYPKAADEAAAKEIEKIEFVNGKVETFEEQDRKIVGEQSYVCWKARGTFRFYPALQNYPFDKQYLSIQVEHASKDSAALVFEDDGQSYERYSDPRSRWGVKESVFIPEYSLTKVERSVYDTQYSSDFGDPSPVPPISSYSHYEVGVSLARLFFPFFFKIVLPLLVTLAMAYLVCWIPPKEIQSATGLAMSALLSCIACNVTVSQNLPSVGYLVTSDKFFICTYGLLFLNLAQSVLTYNLYEKGKEEEALKWDRFSRVAFPVLYVVSFSYLVFEAVVLG